MFHNSEPVLNNCIAVCCATFIINSTTIIPLHEGNNGIMVEKAISVTDCQMESDEQP